MLGPFRSVYDRLIADKGYLLKCAKEGAEKASAIADVTLNKFKSVIGFVPRQG